jgi:hypothetical protein
MSKEVHNIDVCADCYIASEYGVDSIEDFDPQHVPLSNLSDVTILGASCGRHDDCEDHGFSRWGCDGCGSPLGGQRYSIAITDK